MNPMDEMMMGKYAKVVKSKAEDFRNKLLSLNVWDDSRKVVREDDFVFFPVIEGADLSGLEIVVREGPLAKRKNASLKEALSDKLSVEKLVLVPTSFDIIGDIAILELDELLLDDKQLIGDVLLDTFKNIRVVLLKAGKVDTEYRVPELKVIAGEGRTETVHKEHGLRYKLDVAKAYFSPRLSRERMRVVEQIGKDERVLVMFAGVGPYAILAQKLSGASGVAVELNAIGCEYMRKNVLLNHVDVDISCGDVRDIVPDQGLFDRIIMPLPKDSADYLDITIPALKKDGIIHFYVFASSPLDASGNAVESAGSLGHVIEILDTVECGSYSPCLSRYCVDFKVQHSF